MKYISTSQNILTNIKLHNNNINDLRNHFLYYDVNILKSKTQFKTINDLFNNINNGRFSIELDNIHFECLFYKNNGKYLYVSYNGAQMPNLPNFPRWSYYHLLEGSFLSIEDPMYYKFPNLKIGWFYGTKESSYIIKSIDIIRIICKKINVDEENIIFLGSSGGGMQDYMLLVF